MSILNLPAELLDEIASHLVPSMKGDTGSYDPDPEFRRCRLALLSLVKTGNHHLHAIATRHLYHTICIDDLRCLFDLLHTAIHHPRLASFIRVLNLTATLEDALDDEVDARSAALYADITPDMKAFAFLNLCFGPDDDFDDGPEGDSNNDPSGKSHEISWTTADDFAELSFGLLLCLTYNLESLHLHGLGWDQSEFAPLADIFRSAELDNEVVFLPHLSRIALSADPRVDGPTLPEGMPQCFMSSKGNIKHLELFGPCLIHWDLSEIDAKWRGVETIRASYAYSTGAWWYHLCSQARPRLRVVDFELSPGSVFSDLERLEVGCNDAFALCAESLEYLKVGLEPFTGDTSFLGPKRQLCVREMHKLRYLETSVTVLFTSPDALEEADICDVLPASLEQIFLSEDLAEPWADLPKDLDEEDPEREHARLVERAFLQLMLESEQKLSRLQSVRVTARKAHWTFDERQLMWGPYTVEQMPRSLTITCAPKRERGGG